jgi:tetratricopeptide (TPR) repeat protein
MVIHVSILECDGYT